jgi:tetratricopeptide (TPR) repeat protein
MFNRKDPKYNAIARCYKDLKKYGEAIKYYTKAIETPGCDKLYGERGACYLKIGKLKLASIDFKMAQDMTDTS